MGNEALNLTAESISSRDAPVRSRRWHASWTIGMNSLLTMNPGTSLRHTTACLPADLTSSLVASSVPADVLAPGMTSTSFISCGGLKKCMPMNRSGRDVAAAISVMGSVLVFDAKMVSGRAAASSSAYTRFLRSMTSGTTSMTRSASPAASHRSITGVILESMSSRPPAVIFSRSTILSRLHRILPMPLSRNSCRMSRIETR